MSRLENLCLSITDCPHSTPKWLKEGIPVIRNFNLKDGRLDFKDDFYVDQDTYEKRIKRAKPEPGDLVFSREAPIGEVAIIPDGLECCLGQRLVLFKPDRSKIIPQYLLYAIQSTSVQLQIQKIRDRGGTVSNLNLPNIRGLEIPTAPIEVQNEIVLILDTASKLIQEMEEEVKLREEEIIILRKNLFDQIQETNQNLLKDFISIAKGKALGRKYLVENGQYPYYNGGIEPSGYYDQYNTEQGSITISSGGAAGAVNFPKEPFWAGGDCFVVLPKSPELSTRFLWYFLKENEAKLKRKAVGAGIPHLHKKHIENLVIPLIPLKEQRKITDILDTCSDLITTLKEEIELRREEFDLLRNKLLTFD